MILERAIEALSHVVNLGTGLAHPHDDARAKELFKALHKRAVPLEGAAIARIAKECGWSLEDANEIAKLGEKIGRGGRVVIKHPRDWGEPLVARIVKELDGG